MEILFLGTAASEGWPAVFCKCNACMRARQAGGKNIRTRSSCIIDDIYMVDFPPDTYMHVLNNNLELDRVEHLFITHSHEDHFYPRDIQCRKEPYAYINSGIPLTVYGNSEVKKGFDAVNDEEDRANALVFKEIHPFEGFTAKQASVMPLPADHKKDEQAMIFLITIGGKTLLYGHDSGCFPEESFDYMKNVHIDAAIFDCTYGPEDNSSGHMGFPAVLRVWDRLLQYGSVDGRTLPVITHFSHNGKLLHHELEALASPHGFVVAYDGMRKTLL